MARLAARIAMAVVGVTLLAVYLAAAMLALSAIRWAWAVRPGTVELVAILVGVSLTSAYLSYRLGTAQLVAALEPNRLPRERAPGLHRRIDELADRMEIDRPRLYVAVMRAPNALAVGGSERGALVLDRSLFRLLDPDELEGIVAHELSHLETNDGVLQAVVQGIGQTLTGVVALAVLPALLALSGLSRGSAWIRGRPFDRTDPFARLRRALLAGAMVAFVAVTLLIRARSRKREFAADDRAVEVTGNPLALARALRKIERAGEPGWTLAPLSTHRETETPIERWLSTHPPTAERVDRLVETADAESRRRGREDWTGVPIR